MRGTPDEWGRRAVAAYHRYEADRIVYEANQGGEMVAHVLRSIDRNVPLSAVTATRGKYVRAEPVSALYEQGRIHHVGTFAELEDQMVGFTPETAADRSQGLSPDRVDALVWAYANLFPQITRRTESAPDAPARQNDRYDPHRWRRSS
jgi:phage terminase large subunit-like protein